MTATYMLGRDVNGNKLLKVKKGGKTFSIQTLGNLPEVHRQRIEVDPIIAEKEVTNYVTNFGTKRQKQIFLTT
jgi:hypothetical protein